MTLKNNINKVYLKDEFKFVYFSKQAKIEVYNEKIRKNIDSIPLPKEINFRELECIVRYWLKINKNKFKTKVQ